MVPEIDIAALFGGNLGDRSCVDEAIWEAACHSGFMTIVGFPADEAIGPAARASLIRLFEIRGEEQRRFWKRNFAPENPNLYRGWFPLESAEARAREGFEIGPDVVRRLPDDKADDLLYEPSVLPSDERLPGWRATAAAYYRSMESIGFALLASLSRGIGVPEAIFEDAFKDGISTLRLLRYPARNLDVGELAENDHHYTTWEGRRFEIVCGRHVDSGLVTILAQCDASGLQARDANGSWTDVPVKPGALVVNFGGLLARWTGGRVRATEHRVLSSGEERFSIPFFVEPRADTVIAPLPLAGVEHFEPFQYGDHMWATTTKFPENFGLGPLRPPRAAYRDPFAR